MVNKWDKRFLELARLASTWSKDPSTGVGAVIVDKRNRIRGIGFNGLPQGVADDPEILMDRDVKLRLVLHAEENAIDFSTGDLTGCTLYVWPLPPCAHCAAKIAQHDISRVVSSGIQLHRWGEDNALASRIFNQKGITHDTFGEEIFDVSHCS